MGPRGCQSVLGPKAQDQSTVPEIEVARTRASESAQSLLKTEGLHRFSMMLDHIFKGLRRETSAQVPCRPRLESRTASQRRFGGGGAIGSLATVNPNMNFG